MNTRHPAIFVVALALVASVPFAVKTWWVHAPRLATTRAATLDAERAREAERADLAAQLEALRDDRPAGAPLDALRARRDRAGAELDRSAEALDAARERHAEALAAAEAHVPRVDLERVVVDSLRRSLDEWTRLRDDEQAVVVGLEGQLSELDTRLATLTARADGLERERVSWEQWQTWSSLPRVSMLGTFGRLDGANTIGGEATLWLLRTGETPWGLRAGLMSADLPVRTERAYVGPVVRHGILRHGHVGLWAGPYFAQHGAGLDVDPAIGGSLGWSLPLRALSVGLTGIASPDETMFGLTLGISQIGEPIDPYGEDR